MIQWYKLVNFLENKIERIIKADNNPKQTMTEFEE